MPTSSSLYRKYRSQTFDELVGQEPVVRTLKNAIAGGKISHAYLFTGPRGVGKTSAARLLARAANCTSEGAEKPCNKCPNCLSATRDIATDLIEIDAASNTGVDNIREVIERANFAPSVWSTKFYVVDEAHMLSTSAFNALLKTLEEPPPHTAFILATTEVHKIPATVASRCQRFDFRRVALKAMVDRLTYICEQESIDAEPAALEIVAREATGSLRDALSLLDQLRVFAEEGITAQSVRDMLGAGGAEEVAAFVDALIAGDLQGGLRQINRIVEEGLDLRQFNRQVVEHLRALMLLKSGAAAADSSLLPVTGEMGARMQAQTQGLNMADLLRWVKQFGDADAGLRTTSYSQLPLEMAFVAATLQPEYTGSPPGRVPSGTGAAQEPASAPRPGPAPTDRREELQAAVEQIGTLPKAKPPARSVDAPTPVDAMPQTRHEPAVPNGNGSLPHSPIEEEVPIAAYEESSSRSAPPPSEVVPLAPSGPPAGDSMDQLIALWPDFVAQLRARSKSMASVFGNPDMVKPISLSGGLCTITFRDALYARRSMDNSPPHQIRDVIEAALSRVLGYTCRIECIGPNQGGSGPGGGDDRPPDDPGGDGKAPPAKPSPYDTTLGKAARNIFGIEKFEDPQ